MFSLFKYIDVNFVKDTVAGCDGPEGSEKYKSCVWFTIPLDIVEVKDSAGQKKYKYKYLSFPHTARIGNDNDFMVYDTDSAYFYYLPYTSE